MNAFAIICDEKQRGVMYFVGYDGREQTERQTRTDIYTNHWTNNPLEAWINIFRVKGEL